MLGEVPAFFRRGHRLIAKRLLVLSIIAVVLGTEACVSQPVAEADLLPAEQVRVSRVVSGDAFYVKTKRGGYRVRLLGVAAPLMRLEQAHSIESTQGLARRIGGRLVRVRMRPEADEKVHPHVGLVWVEGELVNLRVIEAGHAWHNANEFESEAFADALATARENKLGLWTNESPIPPWNVDLLQMEFDKRKLSAEQKERARVERRMLERYLTDYEELRSEALPILAKTVAYYGGAGNLSKLRCGHLVAEATRPIEKNGNAESLTWLAEAYWKLPHDYRLVIKTRETRDGQVNEQRLAAWILNADEGWQSLRVFLPANQPFTQVSPKVHAEMQSVVRHVLWCSKHLIFTESSEQLRERLLLNRTAFSEQFPYLTKLELDDDTYEFHYHSDPLLAADGILRIRVNSKSGQIQSMHIGSHPYRLTDEQETEGVKYPSLIKSVVDEGELAWNLRFTKLELLTDIDPATFVHEER